MSMQTQTCTINFTSFVQVMLETVVTMNISVHYGLVDVKRCTVWAVQNRESTPWTVDVDASLLIVT